ncbi:hypothetical protein DB347_20400 [Opitutaceae bacterium EW11]|nr:hypothetical protein DB347_20400 [Opitutaceae bacterium EW11]
MSLSLHIGSSAPRMRRDNFGEMSPAFLLLDTRLRVVRWNRAATALLRHCAYPSPYTKAPLPEEFCHACRLAIAQSKPQLFSSGSLTAKILPLPDIERQTERVKLCVLLSGTHMLSPSEFIVIALIARGLRNKEIAALRSTGKETVKTHVRQILAKLGVKSRSKVAAIFSQ